MKRVQTESKIEQQLAQLQNEIAGELDEIISWWEVNVPNRQGAGFYGSINAQDIPNHKSPNGIVLYSRILWTFSAASRFSQGDTCKKIADIAYRYITRNFIDKVYCGVYWSVDARGNMLEGKKQIYGNAFCIYGLSEYYRLSGNMEALETAKELFHCIEQYSFDKINGGYFEALARNWQRTEDVRLSYKDENESKTANTHLHLVEAYANLYSVWHDDALHNRIVHLLELFDKYFIDKNNFHLRLFFDDEWNYRSSLQSYGHDIEASWLLQQCAEVIGHAEYIERFRELGIKLAEAAAEGLDTDGGLWYEYDPPNLVKEKHWWCQAEAIVGFMNAWQVTGKQEFLDKALACWEFVKQYIRDNQHGEWFWGVNEDYSIIPKEKAGFWKCPYHNGRACMEIICRTASLD